VTNAAIFEAVSLRNIRDYGLIYHSIFERSSKFNPVSETDAKIKANIMADSPKKHTTTISKSTSERALEVFWIWDVTAARMSNRDVD
jgi:hypothetical protein